MSGEKLTLDGDRVVAVGLKQPTAVGDGGPAFPISREQEGWYEPGMSLRDWFAGQAMDRMISLSQNQDGSWHPESVAAGCYALADAMLALRAPTTGHLSKGVHTDAPT